VTQQRLIDSPEALYRKLERTFDRRPAYGEHQVDWVFDFAVTAWHLVDWVARKTQAGGSCQRFVKCRFLHLSPHLNRVFRKSVNLRGSEHATFDLRPAGR